MNVAKRNGSHAVGHAAQRGAMTGVSQTLQIWKMLKGPEVPDDRAQRSESQHAQFDPGKSSAHLSGQGEPCRFKSAYSSITTAKWYRAGPIVIANIQVGGPVSQIEFPHEHGSDTSLTLIIVRSGEMLIGQDGQTLSFGPGDAILIDSSLRFTQFFRKLSQIAVLRVPKRALSERGIASRFVTACHPLREGPDAALIREFVLAFASHIDNVSEVLRTRIGRQMLPELLAVLIYSTDAANRGRSAKAVVMRATQLIERRIGDQTLSVEGMADELNTSISSLTRAFRQLGLSPMRHVYALRLEHARRLLATIPGLAIAEIACLNGFASPAHFSRMFKKQHGMTPREYLLHCRLIAEKELA
ncbi:AraC family transcriptional regulator [Paraburkholderia humisilvae]|uniref:AraC family transcriptional regulator n=1 Tax=Paraburkholderia humisilvae TaxID=627669 RepID=UPI00158409B1|nr:AraC family transcriptional regulator [Paraburkholderia humisilvae]